jgi:hypothetical protein
MSRKFEKISIEDLKQKIVTAWCKTNPDGEVVFKNKVPYWYNTIVNVENVFEKPYTMNEDNFFMSMFKFLTPTVEKDLSKIEFSEENESFQERDDPDTGFRVLNNGLTYLGIISGGDWEDPLFYIIYWDGKKLRGYIPDNGNVYNRKYKSAYGNADSLNYDDEDDKLSEDELDMLLMYGEKSKEDDFHPLVDMSKMIEDIKQRILLKP